MFLRLTLCELKWCPNANDGEGAYHFVEKDEQVLVSMDRIASITPVKRDFAKDPAESPAREVADVYMDNGVQYMTCHTFQALCEVLGAEVYTLPVSKAIEPDPVDAPVSIGYHMAHCILADAVVSNALATGTELGGVQLKLGPGSILKGLVLRAATAEDYKVAQEGRSPVEEDPVPDFED